MNPRLRCITLLGIPALAAAAGCSLIERRPPPLRPARIAPELQKPVPQIMRGTVDSETVLAGYQPVLVHGHGLVVGLKGTGSSDVPPGVRAHMVATAARRGIGSERSGWGDLSPDALLDSPDTAVVIVEGIIPPGSPEGTRFDVRVYAYPTSSTTSLEGGRLYTAELYPMVRPGGAIQVMPPAGGRQPAEVGAARGPVFINPFVEPGAMERDTVNRRNGRVLAGGVATRDMPLKLRLVRPSHNRASVLQGAINTRFPQEPGQRDPTARGESDESIEITVPPSHRADPEEFIRLLRHTTIMQVGAEAVAATVKREVMENPATAVAASYRWQALGSRALPVIRELYDYGEELPRLAALRAGARLNDPLVTPHLADMLADGSPDARRQAIDLLAGMGVDPQIDRALRAVLDDEDVELRLAAYEALAGRGDHAVRRVGVDGKFVVDLVESSRPLIYITQNGPPRVALFGTELAIDRPVTMTAWSRRFMIKGDADQHEVEVYYRPEEALQGVIHRVEPALARVVRFLGHDTVPEDPTPGLGFSYSQVVGVLHQMWRQGYLEADFRAEQDRILAAVMRRGGRTVTERPEFSDGDLQGLPQPMETEEQPVGNLSRRTPDEEAAP